MSQIGLHSPHVDPTPRPLPAPLPEEKRRSQWADVQIGWRERHREELDERHTSRERRARAKERRREALSDAFDIIEGRFHELENCASPEELAGQMGLCESQTAKVLRVASFLTRAQAEIAGGVENAAIIVGRVPGAGQAPLAAPVRELLLSAIGEFGLKGGRLRGIWAAVVERAVGAKEVGLEVLAGLVRQQAEAPDLARELRRVAQKVDRREAGPEVLAGLILQIQGSLRQPPDPPPSPPPTIDRRGTERDPGGRSSAEVEAAAPKLPVTGTSVPLAPHQEPVPPTDQVLSCPVDLPVAHADADDTAVTPGEGDGGPADEKDEKDATEPQAEASASLVQVPARKPPRLNHLQELILIPYPADLARLSPAERHLCALLVLTHLGLDLIQDAIVAWQDRQGVLFVLAARIRRALIPLSTLFDDGLLPILSPLALALARPGPAEGALMSGPLALEPEQQALAVPLSYVPVYFPPLLDPEATDVDRALSRLLPLVDQALSVCESLIEALGDGPIRAPLAAQFSDLGKEASFQMTLLLSHLRRAAQAGDEALAKEDAQRALSREAQARADAALVVFGEDHIPPRFCKGGLTSDGRLWAFTLSSPQFLTVLGAQGFGKGHLCTLLAEGASLELDGINALGETGPSHVFVFCNEWRNKKGNRQFLNGLYQNPDPTEIAYLREHFHYAGNAAYERLVLVCLPGMKQHYEQTLPELLERGLEVMEGRLHPSELVQVSYAMLFNNGAESAGREKPKWQLYVEQALADRPGMRPRQVMQLLEDKRMARPAVMKQLQVMETFVSDHERFSGHLGDRAPRVVLLESQTMPRDLVLPVDVMMMNALSAEELAEHLLLVLEEGGKGLENVAVQEAMVNGAQEVRHGVRTTVLAVQEGGMIPARLWPLVTGGALFYVPSPAEYRRLQEQIGPLRRVSYEVVAQLGLGEALLWAVRVSDPRLRGQAVLAKTRPACIFAGGKTRRFT